MRHARSLSMGDRPALSRAEGARLPAVHEDEVDEVEDESPTAWSPQRTRRRGSAEDLAPFSVDEEEDDTYISPITRTQSYRTVSGGVRRRTPEDHLSSAVEEEGFDTRPVRAPSYKTVDISADSRRR